MELFYNIKRLLNSKNLKARALRSGFWVGSGNASEQGMRMIRNIVLTRILAPEAFGLMAIVLTVNGLFQAFTEVGLKEAIIQNPRGQEQTYLNCTWWISFIRGVLLYAIIYFAAPLISKFYNNNELVSLLRVAFLSMIFISAVSPKSTVAMKQLKYFRWALFYNGGGIIGIITALGLSLVYKNVWALVIGFLVENFSRLILSYILFPYLPGAKFNKEDSRAIFKFAGGMFGLPILTVIFLKTDIFVVGKICNMNDLGLYSMAAGIAWVPFQFITMLSTKIIMPAFSEKQKDKEWINKWAFNAIYSILLIGMPMLIFVCLYGKSLLSTIYGNIYGAVATPFAIIFGVALLRTCSVPIAAVYLSSGQPELHRLFVVVRVVIILSVIVPMVKYFRLNGAAASALIAMAISYVFQVWKLRFLTGLSIRPYFTIFIRGLAISLPVFALWLLANYFSFVKNSNIPAITFMPGLIGCLVSYAIIAKPLLRSVALKNGGKV